jgi:membrane protein DedA with SNARE-associated domain
MTLTGIATDLVAKLGYGGLAFGLVVDSMGVPIPSEVLLPIAGVLVRQGRLNFAAVLIVATLAQTIGAWIAYEIGDRGGIVIVKRYGKYVFFNERELAVTQRWFAKYGAALAFFGRCMPIIRTYIGYPAGLGKMRKSVFGIASLAGSFIWSAVLIYAGYALGNETDKIDQVFSKFSLVIYILLAAGVIWYIKRHMLNRDTHAK